jgi:hypothetical protein
MNYWPKSEDEIQTYKKDRSPDNKNDFKVHTPEYIKSINAKNFTLEHDLSHLQYLEFKIQAQENNKVCLFEEMTNVSIPSE